MLVMNPKSGFDGLYGEIWAEGEGVHAVLSNQAHENHGHEEFATVDEAITWLQGRMAEAG